MPAGLFAETRGTTQGNAIRAYSSTITTEDLVSFYQTNDTTDFTGTGLIMNFGNGVNTFTGNFIDLQKVGVSMFVVDDYGTTTIGETGQTTNQAGLQIGYGGLCVDNDGSCNASTTGQIVSVTSALYNSDLAENYFSSELLETGEIIYTKGGLSIGKATQDTSNSIIGVVSTKPGILLGFDDTPLTGGEQVYPVALSGRVPVKVSTEGGIIKPGDKIVLSSLGGIGMKATTSGNIVGIALEVFDGTDALSFGVVNQLNDDIAPALQPETVYDEKNDGCFYGGGNALNEEECTRKNPIKSNDDTSTVATSDLTLTISNGTAQQSTSSSGETVAIGQILVFVNLGWYKLDSTAGGVATGEMDSWWVDDSTGKLTTYFATDLSLGGNSITDVSSISGLFNNWSISEEGVLVVKEVKADRGVFGKALEIGTTVAPTGVTIYDTVTGEPYCMQITNGAIVPTSGVCGSATSPSTTQITSGSTDTSPPIITVLGNNPTEIEIGTSYIDLGATVEDNVNDNLGIQTLLDGIEVNQIQIDTTTEGVYTITYSATDQAGNIGTAERTVTVTDPYAITAEATETATTTTSSQVSEGNQEGQMVDNTIVEEDITITTTETTATTTDTTSPSQISEGNLGGQVEPILDTTATDTTVDTTTVEDVSTNTSVTATTTPSV